MHVYGMFQCRATGEVARATLLSAAAHEFFLPDLLKYTSTQEFLAEWEPLDRTARKLFVVSVRGRQKEEATMWNSCKVLSATKAREREFMGEVVTNWIRELHRNQGRIVDVLVRQSSDCEFHCFSIIIFYQRGKA
jgi:hypothetical protein